MTKFESSVKQIPYPVEDVYRNISDLSNLERVRDRIPQDKLQDFQFDSDSVQVSVSPVGTIKLRICEREENKCVKFETEQSPMPFNLWIQVQDEGHCQGRHPLHAERNGQWSLAGWCRENSRCSLADSFCIILARTTGLTRLFYSAKESPLVL